MAINKYIEVVLFIHVYTQKNAVIRWFIARLHQTHAMHVNTLPLKME